MSRCPNTLQSVEMKLFIMPWEYNLARFELKLKVSYTEPSAALKRETLKCIYTEVGLRCSCF